MSCPDPINSLIFKAYHRSILSLQELYAYLHIRTPSKSRHNANLDNLLQCTRPPNTKSLPLFQHRYLPSPTMQKSQRTRNDIQRQASRVDLSPTGIFHHVMLYHPASDFMRCGFSNVGCQVQCVTSGLEALGIASFTNSEGSPNLRGP